MSGRMPDMCEFCTLPTAAPLGRYGYCRCECHPEAGASMTGDET